MIWVKRKFRILLTTGKCKKKKEKKQHEQKRQKTKQNARKKSKKGMNFFNNTKSHFTRKSFLN